MGIKQEEVGRSPDGSGSRASHEAADASSPEASIPSADESWWVGTSDEFMNLGGPFATRDDAIAEGRAQQGGDPFWICNARLHVWTPPQASWVLDALIDNNDELFYDDGFPGFIGGAEAERAAEEDLQNVLYGWFVRHRDIFPEPTAFSYSSATQQIDASAIEAGTAATPESGAVHESAGPQDDAQGPSS